MKFVMGMMTVLALMGTATYSVAAEENTFQSTERPTPYDQEWECAANNTRRSGPYYGYGSTQKRAEVDALNQCRNNSFFPCWPIPGSCVQAD
ncbi:hypothetical protein K2X33_15875 [bacterium]|nr:hypothetical protein [bacterium]